VIQRCIQYLYLEASHPSASSSCFVTEQSSSVACSSSLLPKTPPASHFSSIFYLFTGVSCCAALQCYVVPSDTDFRYVNAQSHARSAQSSRFIGLRLFFKSNLPKPRKPHLTRHALVLHINAALLSFQQDNLTITAVRLLCSVSYPLTTFKTNNKQTQNRDEDPSVESADRSQH
jgi:hypothetical protein